MKKNIYSVLVLSSIIILIVNIFSKSQYLTDIIVFSVNLFIKNIFPSLFPMFIISGILVEIGVPQFLGSIFNKIFRILFKTSGIASFVFFMSMITGFPSSAKYIDDLISKKVINQFEAQRILAFTFFSNPLFIINTVGLSFLHNKRIGTCIFIAHICGNILVGLTFRKQKLINTEEIMCFTSRDLCNRINNTNIFRVILKSIKNSIEILMNVFGIVTFFLLLINIIFKTQENYLIIFITGVVEMTSGLKYLSIFNCPFIIKVLTSTFFVSFGGLSVHTQIMDILKEKKVKYLPFLLVRIIHAIFSTTIIFFYYFFANK